MNADNKILLVHGAWHGSWCWEPLAELLTQRGWQVESIDLPTVHSDDAENLTIMDDANAVADAIERMGEDVVVVGHSYGGAPVTQGAMSSNVRHIVYIAAFVPAEGESLLELAGGTPPDWWQIDGSMVSVPADAALTRELFYGDVDETVANDCIAQLRHQPLAAYSTPLTQAAWRTHPTTYLVSTLDGSFPAEAQNGLAARAGSHVVSLDASHSPFLSMPAAVADAIEAAAAQTATSTVS